MATINTIVFPWSLLRPPFSKILRERVMFGQYELSKIPNAINSQYSLFLGPKVMHLLFFWVLGTHLMSTNRGSPLDKP